MNLINPNSDTKGEFTTTGNPYRYTGKQYVANELDWLDYGGRYYDPQLGRWHSVDPACEEEDQESWTPYHYVLNNPVKNTDPDGRIALIDNAIGAVVGAAVDYTCQVVANRIANPEQSWSESLTDVSVGSIAVSFVAGALSSGLSAAETISASVVKAGVNKTVANISSKAIVGAVKEGSGQVLDNAIKGKSLGKGVVQNALLGAATKQLDVKIDKSNAQTTIKRYGNGNATTSKQTNMVKSASKEIKTAKTVEKAVNTTTDVSSKVVGKKIEKK
jgi:RHS repeat-associated protein